ncbi:Class I histocompatibility antigen, F10 alpha chain [Willisornis vidua]|uniref:Class I histocompatibility antigen, F10 alpha chain n=1 Tax=Willisornis vidua TaxID=1566151 RepID=A0ABQ9D616_9PASS|nr:Class I histocompatibility antigen, F10 alpha chain [Willisornis vidua]
MDANMLSMDAVPLLPGLAVLACLLEGASGIGSNCCSINYVSTILYPFILEEGGSSEREKSSSLIGVEWDCHLGYRVQPQRGKDWETPKGISILHSLWYLDVAVSEPSPGVPQFMSTGFLDGIPFVRYDSEQGRAKALTPWMENRAEPGYWDRETKINKRNRHVFANNLDTARGRYNQSGGLHTVQRVYGCDLLSDGTVRGFYQDGYDGRDFMSFELGSKSFVAADGAAQVTKRKWETEGIVAEQWTNYLGHTCPEWLQKYVGYGWKALEHKEPPDVHVSGKEEHGILTLSCHAYGFYPGIIGISWMKGDEIRDQETEWGGIVPNSDGTFHNWARIEALPGEREQYRCQVEHAGMPEPGIFAWEPESNWNSTLMVVALSVIAAIIIIRLIRFGVWKLQSGKRERNG